MKGLSKKQEVIDRGCAALFARLEAELKHADDESSTEQFLNAEATVDRYLDAVAQRTPTFPVSEDLAFACALLLTTTHALAEHDMALLGLLCSPGIGVDMVAIAPQVEEMKTRAIARLESLANEPEPSPGGPLIDDVPF